MTSDETIEGISGEAEVQCPVAGRCEVTLGDGDSTFLAEPLRDPSTGLSDPTDFEEGLELEHHERGDRHLASDQP